MNQASNCNLASHSFPILCLKVLMTEQQSPTVNHMINSYLLMSKTLSEKNDTHLRGFSADFGDLKKTFFNMLNISASFHERNRANIAVQQYSLHALRHFVSFHYQFYTPKLRGLFL